MGVDVDQPLVDAYGERVRRALSVILAVIVKRAVCDPDTVPTLDTEDKALELEVT